MKEKTLKLGELFCGPGGFGQGANLSKLIHNDAKYTFEHEWATDIDNDSCKTYETNIKKCKKILVEDIKKIFRSKETLNSFGKIDCMTFGFPCNDFSLVGKQKGTEGDYGPLYKYCTKALNHFKPNYFIAENVSGMKSADEKKIFPKILKSFRNAADGYTLTTHLYKFEEYGVPQKRKRVIIVGVANKLKKIFRVPAPTHGLHLKNLVTAHDALVLKPIPENVKNNERTKNSLQVVERLKKIKPGENAFNASELKSHKKLQLKKTNNTLSQIYKRLEKDKPAYTVTGSGGGGTHMYHWSEPRALTNRERARLQTFPDNFVFMGNKESQRKQIGMAVPVLGAKVIFDALLKTHLGMQYKSIEPNEDLQISFEL